MKMGFGCVIMNVHLFLMICKLNMKLCQPMYNTIFTAIKNIIFQKQKLHAQQKFSNYYFEPYQLEFFSTIIFKTKL